MTATATVDEQLVSAPEDTLLFMCRRSDLRLVKTPRYPIRGAAGQQVGETPGEVVAFRDGALRLPKDGMVRLEDGREIDAEEVVGWLESHRLFGDVQEGFWRVDPTAPPVSREELQRLTDAVTDFDVERLQALLEQERSGWQRADLIDVAERALERIRQVQDAAAVQERERLAAEERDRQAQAAALAKAEADAKAARAEAKAAKASQPRAARASAEEPAADGEPAEG